jgi:hypothetical protein
MTSPDAAAADYVVVIDRTVFRRVLQQDVDIISAAIEAKEECVNFRTDGVTVQARIKEAKP